MYTKRCNIYVDVNAGVQFCPTLKKCRLQVHLSWQVLYFQHVSLHKDVYRFYSIDGHGDWFVEAIHHRILARIRCSSTYM